MSERPKVIDEPNKKKFKSSLSSFQQYFNSCLLDKDIQKELKEQLHSAKPFPHLQICDFIKDNQLVLDLEKEIPNREFSLKSNDLYDFYQSNDLNLEKNDQSICKFKDLLMDDDFHFWLEELTNIKGLHSNIDISSAIYQDGSYLQCHDDKLEGRRIAFIYYLVPDDWSEKEGGELSLFDIERTGIPQALPVKKIIPKRNSLFIFIVSVNSFHRVEQLYSDRGRMSISGWFRGPKQEYPNVIPVTNPYPLSKIIYNDSNNINLNNWINPIYLQKDSHKQIQEQFEIDSQISLHSFLLDTKFNELKDYIDKLDDKQWIIQSPPNHRYYLSCLLENHKNSILYEFYNLLSSKIFVDLLYKLTELTITQNFIEFQQFTNGHFTLMHDGDTRRNINAMDCFFFIIPPNKEWDDGWGGYSSYNDEDGELLTVLPVGNTLSLVYCTKGTSRFTKMLNYHVPRPLYKFYMLVGEDNE